MINMQNKGMNLPQSTTCQQVTVITVQVMPSVGFHRNGDRIDTFSLLPMLCEYAAEKGIQPFETDSIQVFCKQLSDTLTSHIRNPARLFGLRTEAMFAYVAAAMGKCKLINQEDSGLLYSHDPSKIRRPDFRVVTESGEEILIEVKNFHQKTAHEPLKISKEYANSIRKYADLMNTMLMLAVFWSRWKVWTLVDFSEIPEATPISLIDLLPINEMAILGDSILSSEPKLILRLTTSPDKPRDVDSAGIANFTIETAEMYVNQEMITDPIEKKIAWFLFQYSKWSNLDQPVVIRNRKLEQIDMVLTPSDIEESNGQPFASHGFFSQMISNQYLNFTSDDTALKRLSPNQDPAKLGVLIPNDYKGEVLKLWRFLQDPNKSMRISQ